MWLRRMLNRGRDGSIPKVESTNAELDREKERLRVEHIRTDRLARMLADYRAQDRAVRR